jgi:hypothetical protein
MLQAPHYGARPENFNTDQGVQYTSSDFTGLLKHEGIQISMDWTWAGIGQRFCGALVASRQV